MNIENYVKEQNERIRNHVEYLEEERVVSTKDVALKWILEIGENYDDARDVESLMEVIDEILAYAALGLKRCE